MAVRRGVILVIVLILAAVAVSAAGLIFMALMVGREPALRATRRSSCHQRRPAGNRAGRRARPVFRSDAHRPHRSSTRCARRRSTSASRAWSSGRPAPPRCGARSRKCATRSSTSRPRASRSSRILEFGGEQEFYLASACDKVFLMPTSSLDLTGMASYELFLRGTLDKIGAFPDALHIGDYKTASNTFTEQHLHAGAPRDGGVAQHRSLRAAGARPRRRPPQVGSGGPRAHRSRPVPARGRASAPAWSTISPTRTSSTTRWSSRRGEVHFLEQKRLPAA